MHVLPNQALLSDDRSNCLSVTLITTVGDYLEFIKKTYDNRGGLDGQRLPLKTKTAIKIRGRMIDDLLHGAVLPPIVIGVVPNDAAEMAKLKGLAEAGDIINLTSQIEAVEPAQIAIIDGMQRTTALLEALEKDQEKIISQPVRLELWIGQNANSLIYRMLVLNTGQVPWDIKRQLETVYTFLLKEIESRVTDISVFKIDDRNRRSTGGQYQSSIIIEGYFAFTSRKPNVDIKERVAEDFARIDATESAAEEANLKRFIEVLRLLVNLDKTFARYTNTDQADGNDNRFAEGRDIFKVRAAIIGFISAAAVWIYGEPGFEFDFQKHEENTTLLIKSISSLTDKLNNLPPTEVGAFLQLDILSIRLLGKTGGVGDFEREVFHRAFLSAIKHGDSLPNMVPCWRAGY
ncbi:hypothetical protein [Pseudomonas sp. TUM22785]|uniref:hypothetical protein n=1 Tax=Pseudomonas sp. TUM22785 TaxID=3019098 RepID=UPI002305A8FB|nr:hypothetical protein [Pseudomonas sp. TUM22785]WCD81013.1 hypothetical protein PI990_03065 [Pseudomonas sp. TUM22785]